MSRFLQEHLVPQAQEIDRSNEFKNFRVSHEAGSGGSPGAGQGWAGLGIELLPGRVHTASWQVKPP